MRSQRDLSPHSYPRSLVGFEDRGGTLHHCWQQAPCRSRVRALVLLALLLAAGGPLGLRTQGPLRELFLDVTSADARPIDAVELDVRYSVANSWNEPMLLTRHQDLAQQFLDEEADSISLRIKAPWPGFNRVWTSIEWKLTEHSGGWSDGPIEAWHSLIGSFNYQRAMFPRNQVHLIFADTGGTAFHIDSPTLAPGDATIRTQGSLLTAPVALAARFDFKLPIGSLSDAGGSGGFDAGAGLVATWPFCSWGTLHGLFALSGFSNLSAPTALQPKPWHWTFEASLEAQAGAVTVLLETRALSPLFGPGWNRVATGLDGDDALLSSGLYADFRVHNQISLAVRYRNFTLWLSEDFTPGPNPHSTQTWIWVDNAPDVVLGLAYTVKL
jgi:Protein of unknown function (DUF3187)